MDTYHFGVPKKVIWSLHILIGIYFICLGYIMLETKFKIHGVILIILGALMSAYQSHLWILHSKQEHEH